ncbi:MAG: SUMF1/EgtB/PvdO family nonheme iron enzyme [Anaerolineae bacterium]|nr:SUMF1/EgtB/PvdO family nonheme iron enzyme [Anaerolineae bacterium]
MQKYTLPVLFVLLLTLSASGCGAPSTAAPTAIPPTERPTEPPTPAPPLTATPEPPPGNPVRAIDQMTMVAVAGGTFAMGSESSAPGAQGNEFPQHLVTVDSFWIDQTEVSNSQFAAFLNEMGNQSEGGTDWLDLDEVNNRIVLSEEGTFQPQSGYEEHPVVAVSWYGAAAYCAWAGARLPTEAEWEYAARGPESQFYPWGNEFEGTRLNYCDVNCSEGWADPAADDGYAGTAPVGGYPEGASWCGALDLAGNVWEWTADWYGDYSPDEQTNPTGPPDGQTKVVRGGSWDFGVDNARGAARAAARPRSSAANTGFRCATSTAP